MLRLAIASSTGLLVGCVMLLAVWFFAASEAQAAPYQQVVDNSTSGRFKVTTTWGVSSYSSQRYGKNYRFAKPAKRGAAAYKIKTPRTGFYTVCGRWPANSGYNSYTAIRINTTGGVKIRRVNQRKNGGRWVRIGTYRIKGGDAYRLAVLRNSNWTGYVIADAFKIIRAPDRNGVACTTSSSSDSSGGLTSAEKGRRIVNVGKKYVGTPYYLGGPSDCVPSKRMDCSCLTLTAYKKAINMSLPDDPVKQWQYGRKVSTPRKGDLLFYDEDGAGGLSVTHVGIYAGKNSNGTPLILHASSYWGKVVVKPMRWPGDGYMGARRLV